ELDGLETTRRIRSDWPPDAQPRIVALTANATRDDCDDCAAAGMDEHLAKPVRTPSLEAVLVRAGEWARERQGGPAGETGAPRPAPPAEAKEPAGGAAVPSAPAPAIDPAMLAELRQMRETSPEVLGELLDAYQADSVPLLRG